MKRDPVTVTGTAIICSIGGSTTAAWNAVISGKCGIGPIEGFDASGFPCAVAAQVHNPDLRGAGIYPKDSRIMDVHSFLLKKAVRDAFSEARLDSPSIPRGAIGFFAGMGMVDYRVDDLLPAVLRSLDQRGDIDYGAFYAEGYREIHPLWPLSMLNNISFCQVAIDLDIQGENTLLSPHADSGALAVAEAMKSVEEGTCRIALACGVSETITPCSLARAHLSHILNATDGENATVLRPFDPERKGTVLGEGCGVIAIERHSSAARRGLAPLAAITGYGAACERDGAFPCPSARVIADAMKVALAQSELDPPDVDLIIAHGDGTVGGDRNEALAIHDVFGGHVENLMVFSSKCLLGHLLAAAPVVDLILGISMLREGLVPIAVDVLHRETTARLSRSGTGALKTDVRTILINCQGSEGQAVSLVLETTAGGV